MSYALSRSIGHEPFLSRAAIQVMTESEVRGACGGFVAVILAMETGTTSVSIAFDDPDEPPFVAADDGTPRPLQLFKGKPLVSYAVRMALEAGVRRVVVVAAEDDAQRAATERAVRAEALLAGAAMRDEATMSEAGTRLGSEEFDGGAMRCISGCEVTVEVVAFDAARARAATRAAAGFEFNSIEKGVLDYAKRAVLDDPACCGALVLGCGEVRMTADRLALVAKTLRDDPALDAATSWITWAPRLPIAFSRSFLASLDDAPYARACEDADLRLLPGMRPLPHLNVREVVFGEESVSAAVSMPKAVEEFFAECTLSAREAVRKARTMAEEGAVDEAVDVGEAVRDSATSVDSASRLCAADALLLDTAREVTLMLDEKVAPDCARGDLAWADAWAKVNELSFPLLNDKRHAGKLAYLDSAATTQRLSSAIAAQTNFDLHENANVYRGAYELSQQATLTLNDARATLEEFIGAKRRETVLVANASAACSLAAQAWGERNIGEGDVIVIPLSEHHSNFLPWLMLADRKHARIVSVPLLGNGHIDQQAYRRALAEKPKLVCMAHMSNVLGIVNPVREMADAAHEVGARVLVDAAQSIAHIALNVRDLHADFVAFSAHKMYAPAGLGGLWVFPDAFAEMESVTAGGGTVSHVSQDSYYLRQGAIRYELGTPPVALAVGWAAALDHLRTLGMDNVERHERILSRYLSQGLARLADVTVWGSREADEELVGLVSFSLCGVAPAEVGRVCGKLGVAIRSGGHCAIPLACSMGAIGTSRASLGIHTTKEDIEALLVAVAVCGKLYERR